MGGLDVEAIPGVLRGKIDRMSCVSAPYHIVHGIQPRDLVGVRYARSLFTAAVAMQPEQPNSLQGLSGKLHRGLSIGVARTAAPVCYEMVVAVERAGIGMHAALGPERRIGSIKNGRLAARPSTTTSGSADRPTSRCSTGNTASDPYARGPTRATR